MGYWIAGADGAFAVNTSLGIVLAFAFFFLARMLLGPLGALASTLVFLCAPMLLTYSVVQLTHTADMTFIVLSFLFCLRWVRYGNATDAAIAGLCVGFMPLIRAVDVLMYPAILLLIFAEARHSHKGKPILETFKYYRHFLIAFAFPLLATMLYNQVVFGAFWKTGYYLTLEQSQGFDIASIPSRIPNLLDIIRPLYLGDIAWICVGLGLVYGLIRRPLYVTSLALWVTPSLLLYMSYYFFNATKGATHGRFYLSIFPAIALLIGFMFLDFKKSRILSLLGLIAIATWVYQQPYTEALHFNQKINASTYRNSTKNQKYFAGVSELLEPGTIVYTSRHLSYYINAFPDVEAYNRDAWNPAVRQREFRIASMKKEGYYCWYDSARHEKIAETFKAYGTAGLKDEFYKRLDSQLQAGKKILFIGGKLTEKWVRQNPQYKLEELDLQVRSWKVQRLTSTVSLANNPPAISRP